MSAYKRFVSYIYGYDQGEKRENTGFVKVNARGGECKIWVHVRGFYTHHQKPYRVYAFRPARERLEGQYLGELESRNGALEWNGVTDTDSLMGGFSLEESRGIYIQGEDKIYAAEWDDYPVDVNRFVSREESARQERMEALEGTDAADTVDTETDTRTGYPESQETLGEIRAAAVGKEYGAEQEASGPADVRAGQWRYLEEHFPVMRYQDGVGGTISSIRLGNRDLSRIPRDKWELGNNSFLLHGFYQHRHLLLLRRETPEEISYYLGVPGIYNEKEQMLASMFGFREFRRMKEPEQREGIGGYWCREVK